FHRLIPPWENVEVVVPSGKIENGSEIVAHVKVGPLKSTWIARHFDVIPPKQFCDEMIEGPFQAWTHQHLFRDQTGKTQMIDRIDYELPLGRLGHTLGRHYTEDHL